MQSLTHQLIVRRAKEHAGRADFPLPGGTVEKIVRFGAPIGSTIEQHIEIPRCMARIKELINRAEEKGESLSSGTIVLARQLKNGSGRFDREWLAPPGGVWMALAWADTLLPEYTRLLPVAAGTACCETLREFGVNARIKWVNDIHVRGRKICGILCETFSGAETADRYHIIGIGINCNNTRFTGDLRQSATSMQEILGGPVDLENFTVALLASLVWNFGLVHYQEELELEGEDGAGTMIGNGPVMDAWERLSDSVGRRVVYGYDVVRRPLFEGIVRQVKRSGALVVELDNGETVTEHSGEIIYLD